MNEEKGCAIIIGLFFISLGIGFLWSWPWALIFFGLFWLAVGIFAD